ncbi:DUF2975 domain-containing protein [Arthrobacter sp. zg-Y769]|uniref:DUF2975 domain-containing protein n=1 Tax=Arthrobacter sp. zg-Y769 TaxID=2894191 RepID=UPI001E423DE0|nr:DUF2975 domain-containing protein [Arthrobacter sp. zg-Y769]MCC9204964.1 DUF2975 domain-containing protein [Arthrobacter sp. zg-Y769]
MNPSWRYPNPLVSLLARLVLGILAAAVIAGEVIVVRAARTLAQQYPEFEPLQTPLVGAAIAFGISVEIVFLITGVLAGYISDGRIFGKAALKLVDLLTAAAAFATIVVAFTLFLIPGPPALALVIIGGMALGSAFTLILVVLRSLLHGAVSMREELDVVV